MNLNLHKIKNAGMKIHSSIKSNFGVSVQYAMTFYINYYSTSIASTGQLSAASCAESSQSEGTGSAIT